MTHINRQIFKFHTVLLLILVLSSTILTSCNRNESQQFSEAAASFDNEASFETLAYEDSDFSNTSANNEDEEAIFNEPSVPELTDDDLVPFDLEDPFSYCNQPICTFNKDSGMLDFTIEFSSIPKSDDMYIYLFEFASYEDDNNCEKKAYVTKEYKNFNLTISFQYTDKYLFSRFVPAISYENKYYPLALGQYITNPEDIAQNDTPYPNIASKKGILLDPLTIDKEELTSLNVKRAVFNIPLSFIMGETENDAIPTVDYEYLGKVYHFNGYRLAGFDSVFWYLSNNNYHVTAIVLNDWNEAYPEIIHPLSRKKTSKSMYYAFNTEEKEGVRAMEAAALFLADRYSNEYCGLIHDWVIANEINEQKIWNYMATDDLSVYMESFEKSFRSFYNAFKSRYKNAKVYYSIDQNWNRNGGANYLYFNGKDVVSSFNDLAKARGNYDWGLSIHPYPSPLTKTRFWNGNYDKSENAKVVTPMNLSVITDYMNQYDFLDTKGNVRQIGVTELGFSSAAGEKTQAAAFAYCYYIIDENEYINSFLMNRQTDSYESLQSGLALGIYNSDYSPKYIADVFANIDTPKGKEYIPEMLNIIGADSLEEALANAR